MAVVAISYITTTTTTAITIRCPNYNFHMKKKKKVGICSQRNSLFSSINNGKTPTTLSIVICLLEYGPKLLGHILTFKLVLLI